MRLLTFSVVLTTCFLVCWAFSLASGQESPGHRPTNRHAISAFQLAFQGLRKASKHMVRRLGDNCQLKPPLFLSDYISSNNVAQARQLARVILPDAGIASGNATTLKKLVSYSGFIKVNESDSSQMFFWLFETTNAAVTRPEQRPLIIWLNGGPGQSSLIGAFIENGPLATSPNGRRLFARNATWTDIGNMLYIDQPVGTGFSFTATNDGYARNEVQVGQNLYSFIVQFYQLFPEYRTTPLYIAGESYAGKYIPAFAYRIYRENRRLKYGSQRHIPLVGIAIGDAWIDPESMILAYGPLLYNLGMFDQVEADFVTRQQERTVELIRQGRFLDAFEESSFLCPDENGNPSFFTNATGSDNVYNALLTRIPKEEIPLGVNEPHSPYYTGYLQRCDVRNALHVGNLAYNGVSGTTFEFLIADTFASVRQWVPTVFEKYRTLLYNGQFDIIVGVPLTEMFLSSLVEWRQQQEWFNAARVVWKINGPNDTKVSGYVKSTADMRFNQAVVRKAGHYVLIDQPERGFDLMRRFVNEVPYET